MVKVSNVSAKRAIIEFEKLLPASSGKDFSAEAANELHQLLLAELERTTLSQNAKNEIAGSMTNRLQGNGGRSISITSVAAIDAELGTRFEAEQPFITRARIQAESRFPSLFKQAIGERATPAAGNRKQRRGSS